MNKDSEAAVIINDLDNLVHHIEALQANVHYTDALIFVQHAKEAMRQGRGEIHQQEMKERFAAMDFVR
jgi:hypothetical protein